MKTLIKTMKKIQLLTMGHVQELTFKERHVTMLNPLKEVFVLIGGPR